MFSSILAKIGIFAIASSAIAIPVTFHQSFVAPPESITSLESKEAKKENCFIIPAKSTFDSIKIKLLVCLNDEEEYYLFDSDEDKKFLKIASLQFNPTNKQITVKLESEEEGSLEESLWSETFVVTGEEWNDISKVPSNLLDICTLSRDVENEKVSSSNLWICGKDLLTLSAEESKGIPLIPFKER